MTKRTGDFENFMPAHVNLNKARYERLQTSARAVSEYLSQNLPGFQKAERQGSFALRTIIKPVNDHEFDADMLIFMEEDADMDPKDYIAEIHRTMKANGNYADKVHRKTRCVEIDYAGDFHMDLVPCVEMGDGDYICNRQTNKFEPTDGTGFREWFNGKNAITHGNLKRVARLLKYLRDHKETFTAPSVLLTTLIGSAVWDSDDGSQFKTLPDALITVTNRINDFLQANPFMPEITNPALPEEVFSRDWDTAKYQNFRDMFDSYTNRINDAFAESDHARSVSAWQDLFGDDFGRSSSSSGRASAATAPAAREVTPRKPYADSNPSARLPVMTRLSEADLDWMRAGFPGLTHDPAARSIEGTLEFSAAYNDASGKVRIGREDSDSERASFLSDAFSVRIDLGKADANGWPLVYETGGRYREIADREGVDFADLHFYPDGQCCLGIQYAADRRLTVETLIDGLLIPFFYRLSYVDRHGLASARRDLWGEYAHGEEGYREYESEIMAIASANPSRNDPCPCGNDLKYKRCHLDEVESVKRARRQIAARTSSPTATVPGSSTMLYTPRYAARGLGRQLRIRRSVS